MPDDQIADDQVPESAVGVIVVAAGRGERLGHGIAKALVEVSGRPLLAWALDGVMATNPARVVVVGPAEDLPTVQRWTTMIVGERGSVVSGGTTRQASVNNGLAALAPEIGLVLVHDAARCFTPPAVLAAVADQLRAGARVVIPAIPVVDTLRRREGGVVDRSSLVAVQTPQGFEREVLVAAHQGADPEATDDALLAERNGETVVLVDGSAQAFKVTTPFDLVLAEAVAAANPSALVIRPGNNLAE